MSQDCWIIYSSSLCPFLVVLQHHKCVILFLTFQVNQSVVILLPSNPTTLQFLCFPKLYYKNKLTLVLAESLQKCILVQPMGYVTSITWSCRLFLFWYQCLYDNSNKKLECVFSYVCSKTRRVFIGCNNPITHLVLPICNIEDPK